MYLYMAISICIFMAIDVCMNIYIYMSIYVCIIGFNDVGFTGSQEWWDPGTPVVFFVLFFTM